MQSGSKLLISFHHYQAGKVNLSPATFHTRGGEGRGRREEKGGRREEEEGGGHL